MDQYIILSLLSDIQPSLALQTLVIHPTLLTLIWKQPSGQTKTTKGKWLAANQVDGLQTICLRPSKVASRQTEGEQEMEKGDRGVQRAWSVSDVINDSQSHSRDPGLRYIGGASGGSHTSEIFLLKWKECI